MSENQEPCWYCANADPKFLIWPCPACADRARIKELEALREKDKAVKAAMAKDFVKMCARIENQRKELRALKEAAQIFHKRPNAFPTPKGGS